MVSVWDSVANWLLHFRKGTRKNQTETGEQSDRKQTVAISMEEVQTVEPTASRVYPVIVNSVPEIPKKNDGVFL